MSERREITRSTSILGFATGLSRIGGLVRDMVVAWFFGAGFATDAFFVAFTIPNLLRRFFAEGSLTAAFVPVFTEICQLRGEDEARRVANICWTLLTLVMVAVTAIGILSSPLLVRSIGFGFGAVEGKLALTDGLNRLMFPYIFFASLLALATGILNVRGHFFVPALSPLMLNLSMILSAVALSAVFDPPIYALAAGVLLGGLLQLLMQFPVLARHGFLPKPDFAFADLTVRRIAGLMVPGIFGVAIYQINVILTRLLASFLPQGSVSYLYYGQRLFEFPQGVFIVSLAQAVLPSMSRQAAAQDLEELRHSLDFALSLMLLVILPATVGLLLCAEPVYALFFMRGSFDATDVRQTALALAAYAPGLLFVGFSRILAPTFYALKDTRTPVRVSFWTLLVNAGLGLLLMVPLRHVGLALALSLASMFNAAFLWWRLKRKLPGLGAKRLGLLALRLLLPVTVMALTVALMLRRIDWLQGGQMLTKTALLAAAVVAGTVVYGLACLLFRVPEVAEAWRLVRRKFGGGRDGGSGSQ
ncbi:putative peptidoglycan lipid II flippase [Geothermobacter ehrlichii]|uniref:Probable lipid II flippase MurJ n=1 Tax=Geothermobacter ehrlichii TaxID=213224 RepID=A0A5D3WNN8_9BACT|nr:murein biosynthesis integral membrane protein MurJ [Geothermobacter ehrlichii]TYP00145.1 putative peptidoglycan lipid II flippase [Geothermobacter ehrlichii]